MNIFNIFKITMNTTYSKISMRNSFSYNMNISRKKKKAIGVEAFVCFLITIHFPFFQPIFFDETY